jgi:hypothetical protein
MVKDSITAKREGEAGCDGDTPDEKKKRTPRLPEKYCVNKKKQNAPATHSYFRTSYYKNFDYHGLLFKISHHFKGTNRPGWISLRVVSLHRPLNGHQSLYVFDFLILILNI